MAKKEKLMLAHKYNPAKNNIGGWFLSEKLDGHRAFWDGGVSRGMLKENVPWADTSKDERLRTTQVSTGLWSRLGNVIHAPDWWLDELPEICLDGELWITQNSRQRLFKIVKKHVPRLSGWKCVRFMCFDNPPLRAISGHLEALGFGVIEDLRTPFKYVLETLRSSFRGTTPSVAEAIEQVILPNDPETAEIVAFRTLDSMTQNGSEGIMLRNPESTYQAIRSHNLLKLKKLSYGSGMVIGYVTGRRTTKGSKLLGLMGALVVQLADGQQLELSGFTNLERILVDSTYLDGFTAIEWAEAHPGSLCPSWITAINFPRKSYVHFMYRGLSNTGIPQEARFCRT